ncbi:MAG: type II secretion system protein GspE [Proteobacteria bacterium]|nr:MAG: type II secretion system protein GspE [Pseudomonadota bacterium]PIE67763.1 MAG: type II secretion system protein GspE [Deltaproteobacteria bacterium]
MAKRIGDILIDLGFIDRDQLEMAVSESQKTGIMLGDVLLRLDWVSQEQLQMSLAVQSGAKRLDTDAAKIDPALVAQVPQEFVVTHGIIPLQRRKNTILAATNNPFDVVAKDKLARITGCQVKTYIASKEWLAQKIELYYKTAQAIDADIDRITYSTVTETEFEENQIVVLADRLIEKGLVLSASDIHVVPDVNLVRIYYRIDGVLQQKFLFPIRFHKSLVTRFKIKADMDISNPNIPHDGRIKYRGEIGDIDVRVSTFPTHLGETVVMRLLVYSKVVGNIGRLGLEAADYKRFLQTIRRPYGLIVATGPTGSGKTTTLYSALMAVNNPNINVMTVEDPIEYVIPTIRQTAVNPKAGLSFGNALRSAMRQDPDIILVGEIRDTETADLALRASMTGHLVFSTLHTNDAASAINRLLDLGVNKNILASSLSMVVAQRLVRKICPHCCNRAAPTAQQAAVFKRHGIAVPERLVVPVGCKSCFQAGYRGRTGIYEVIHIDHEIQALIFSGALQSAIEETAVKSGTSLMFEQALKKAAAGITSFEEVYRVVADA